MRLFLCLLALTLTLGHRAEAQTPTPQQQVQAAIAAAPEGLRDGASVLGYDEAGELISLREGSGQLVCLADDPADDRFHAACYHASLDPFMVRGRALKKEGYDGAARDSIRRAEIEAGTLPMPEQAAALYALSGPANSFDAATGEVDGARPLYVVYLPFATEASTGLPPSAPPGQPWLMEPGTPWAHIMIVPPRE